MISLEDTKITRIDFKNKVYAEDNIELQAKVRTSINSFNEEGTQFIAASKIKVTGKCDDKELISIKMTIEGLFSVQDEDDTFSPDIDEVQSFLFPFGRAYISALTSVSGLPAIVIPSIPE